MNIFSATSLLGRFMNFVANIVILHFLWLLFSLPIFTIGASSTALYYSLMKWIRRDEGYIHTNFLQSFKSNFKQSTIIWLILLFLGSVLFLDLRIGMFFSTGNNSMIGKAMVVSSAVMFVPYILICTYIFPIQAKFENPILYNLKNSLLMSIAHFGYTLLIFLFFIIFVLMTLTSKAFIGLEILCGVGLYGYLTANIFIHVFRKHLPNELEEDAIANGIDNPEIQ